MYKLSKNTTEICTCCTNNIVALTTCCINNIVQVVIDDFVLSKILLLMMMLINLNVSLFENTARTYIKIQIHMSVFFYHCGIDFCLFDLKLSLDI